MIYLFSSKPKTIVEYFRSKNIRYELVDNEKYGIFLQTYIPDEGDLGVVYDFGKIIPESLLQNLLLLNVHFSLLPKYRGAIPVEAALLSGEKDTGITIQKMAKKMDAGDILLQETTTIEEGWSAGTLQAVMDAQVPTLLEKLFLMPREDWKYKPQVGEPTFCYMKGLNRENAFIDFSSMTAEEILRKVHAYNPEPMAWTTILRNNKPLEMNILSAEINNEIELSPKQCHFVKKAGLAVGTKAGTVMLQEIIVSGSKPLRNGDIVALKGTLTLN